jgi:hypothetical protein
MGAVNHARLLVSTFVDRAAAIVDNASHPLLFANLCW